MDAQAVVPHAAENTIHVEASPFTFGVKEKGDPVPSETTLHAQRPQQ